MEMMDLPFPVLFNEFVVPHTGIDGRGIRRRVKAEQLPFYKIAQRREHAEGMHSVVIHVDIGGDDLPARVEAVIFGKGAAHSFHEHFLMDVFFPDKGLAVPVREVEGRVGLVGEQFRRLLEIPADQKVHVPSLQVLDLDNILKAHAPVLLPFISDMVEKVTQRRELIFH